MKNAEVDIRMSAAESENYFINLKSSPSLYKSR